MSAQSCHPRCGYLRLKDSLYTLVPRWKVAMDSGLTFEQFDGATRGIRGAVEVFPQADLVVGVHGAGLANTIFCRPGGESGIWPTRRRI